MVIAMMGTAEVLLVQMGVVSVCQKNLLCSDRPFHWTIMQIKTESSELFPRPCMTFETGSLAHPNSFLFAGIETQHHRGGSLPPISFFCPPIHHPTTISVSTTAHCKVQQKKNPHLIVASNACLPLTVPFDKFSATLPKPRKWHNILERKA